MPWAAVSEPGEVIHAVITAQTTCSARQDSDLKGTLGPEGFATLSANIWGFNARDAIAPGEVWLSSHGGVEAVDLLMFLFGLSHRLHCAQNEPSDPERVSLSIPIPRAELHLHSQ